MKWVGVLSIVFILVGCKGDLGLNFNPSSDSNYIDYTKPRWNITEENVTENLTIEVNDTTVEIEPSRIYNIGAWNVQVFGRTKAAKPLLYDAIVDVIDDYDIIAIQEIRDKQGEVIVKLKQIPHMNVKESARLGRSISKEQYVFMYSDRVYGGRTKQFPDYKDAFERPPFMMEFKIDNYRFVAIVVHIKPDDAEQEIKALFDVVVPFAENEFKENDIIIMGDLNMDCLYFSNFDIVPDDVVMLIDNDADTTTTKTDCAYDRIILSEENENFIASGIDMMEDEVKFYELFEGVSDHYPVYTIYEAPKPEPKLNMGGGDNEEIIGEDQYEI
jgi:hypothetical protein